MRRDFWVEEGVKCYGGFRVWGDVLAGLELGHFAWFFVVCCRQEVRSTGMIQATARGRGCSRVLFYIIYILSLLRAISSPYGAIGEEGCGRIASVKQGIASVGDGLRCTRTTRSL